MTSQKYKYDSVNTQAYLDMLQKVGYLVKVHFDKSLRYYDFVEVYLKGEFLGKFKNPRDAWNRLNGLCF